MLKRIVLMIVLVFGWTVASQAATKCEAAWSRVVDFRTKASQEFEKAKSTYNEQMKKLNDDSALRDAAIKAGRIPKEPVKALPTELEIAAERICTEERPVLERSLAKEFGDLKLKFTEPCKTRTDNSFGEFVAACEMLGLPTNAAALEASLDK